jgi:hypothetical protein
MPYARKGRIIMVQHTENPIDSDIPVFVQLNRLYVSQVFYTANAP